jgi:hypothetical protein
MPKKYLKGYQRVPMKFTNTHIILAFLAGIIACKLLKKEGYGCKKEGYATKMPKFLKKKEGYSSCSKCGI